MGTVIATVKGSNGSYTVRFLFDQACARSFARTDVLKRVGAKNLAPETLAVAGFASEKRVHTKQQS